MKVGIPASTVSTKHCTTHTCSFQQIRSFFSIYNFYLFEKKTHKKTTITMYIYLYEINNSKLSNINQT